MTQKSEMDLFNIEKFREMYGRDGESLILYLETRAVDYGGRVDVRHMNKDDMDLCPVLVQEKIIHSFRRLPAKYILSHSNTHKGVSTHFVEFTSRGWEIAHILRRERAARMTISTKATMEQFKEGWNEHD